MANSTTATTTTTVSYTPYPSPSAAAGGGGGITFQQPYQSPQPTPSNYTYMHVQQQSPSFQYQQSSYSGAAPFLPPPPPQHFQGNRYNDRHAYPSADPSWPVAADVVPQPPAVLPVGPLPIDNNSAAFFAPTGPSAYNYGGEGEMPSPSLSLSPGFHQIQQSGPHQWAPAKEARTHRRLVRQRSAALRATAGQQHDDMEQRLSPSVGYVPAATSAGTPSSSTTPSSSRASFVAGAGAGAGTVAPSSNTNINFLPANDMGLQRLRFLLQKELQNSDVSHLGRIVLPKREAEMHLPYLEVKEGISIMVRDVFSQEAWIVKYRFWPNNKSRMYVLENTGEFVKKYRLQCGDFIALYQDEGNQIYICAKKVTGMYVEEDESSNDTMVVQSGGSSNDMNNDNFIGGMEVQ